MSACACRKPKTHKDCAYCGVGGDGIHICGVCKEEGIDGPVIRGTERRTCEAHKRTTKVVEDFSCGHTQQESVMEMNFTKALAVRERPSHRITSVGPEVMTSVELVATVAGSKDPMAAASRLMTLAHGSFRRLGMMHEADIGRAIGPAGAKRLIAALEIGRRLGQEERAEGRPLRSPKDVYGHYAPRLEDLGVEEFHVAILNSQYRMERDVVVTRGILNSSLVHPREVFHEAIAERAAAIILIHNHPSGDPTPSSDDRLVTEQLVAAGRLLDIPVHDHVIIGRGKYTSFAESGLL